MPVRVLIVIVTVEAVLVDAVSVPVPTVGEPATDVSVSVMVPWGGVLTPEVLVTVTTNGSDVPKGSVSEVVEKAVVVESALMV